MNESLPLPPPPAVSRNDNSSRLLPPTAGEEAVMAPLSPYYYLGCDLAIASLQLVSVLSNCFICVCFFTCVNQLNAGIKFGKKCGKI
jgi:hypothetical protein